MDRLISLPVFDPLQAIWSFTYLLTKGLVLPCKGDPSWTKKACPLVLTWEANNLLLLTLNMESCRYRASRNYHGVVSSILKSEADTEEKRLVETDRNLKCLPGAFNNMKQYIQWLINPFWVGLPSAGTQKALSDKDDAMHAYIPCIWTITWNSLHAQNLHAKEIK